jgi:hypothetical protein
MEIVEVKFKHWKSGDILTRFGKIVHNNSQSDRIVMQLDNGKYEDIIRDTIVEITCNGNRIQI